MFAGLGSQAIEAADVIGAATRVGGTAYVVTDRDRDRHPAFATLLVADDRAAVESVADLGLYVVEVRRMRHQRRTWPVGTPTPGVTGAFAMVRHHDLTHEQADAHWRDVHAPLALRHHPGMWHYHQITISDVLAGPAHDGIALCAFASEQDMAERFFGGPEDRAIIAADVARFSDMERSPRRVRMIEWRGSDDDG